MTLRSLATFTLIGAATAAAAVPGAFPGPRSGPRFPDPGRLAVYLELDEGQQAAFEGLVAAHRETVTGLREEQRARHQELRAALEAGAEAAEIGAIVLALEEGRSALREVREGFDAELTALLTADQAEKYQHLKEALRVFLPGPWGSRGFGPGAGPDPSTGP